MFRRRAIAFACSVAALSTSLLLGSAANAAPLSPDSNRAASSRTDTASNAMRVYDLLKTSSNPKATFLSLSASDQKAFKDYFLASKSTVSATIAPVPNGTTKDGNTSSSTFSSVDSAMQAGAASTTCWAGSVKATETATFGNAVWDIFTEGEWCGNGSTATSATFSRSWSSIAVLGWRDAGLISKGAGVVSGKGRVYSQRKMIFGSGGWDVQTLQPCARLLGTKTGNYSSDLACTIY